MKVKYMRVMKAVNDNPQIAVGQLSEGFFTEVPSGWIECQGQSFNAISNYPDLIKVLKDVGYISVPKTY
jgi:hypothetical protein